MEKVNGQLVSGFVVWSSKDEQTVSVDVSVDPCDDGKEVRITTKDVQVHLESKGYKIDKCLQSSVVTNTGERRLGNWIFSLVSAGKSAMDELVEETEKLGLYNTELDSVESSEETPKKRKKKMKEDSEKSD